MVGDAALLVDPYDVASIADGLERVLGDASLRQALVARGLERVQAFSWERSVRAIHAGYLRALGLSPATVAAEQPS